MELNPSAAASLAEGLEDTLTVHQLDVHARLRRSLTSTNGIESSFSVVDNICRQVKRWQGGDHRLRWIARPCSTPSHVGTDCMTIVICRC
jgi:putative transposase